MDKNVWMLLRSAEINESHFWPIRDIIDDFTNIVNANEVIHSIYFYDTVHSFVISNSKFSKLDFYDKDILEVDKEGNMPNSAFVKGVRTINNSKIISYMKKFDVFEDGNVGYFIFNIDYDELFRDVAREQSDIYSEYIIFNGDKLLYFPEDSIINLLDPKDISKVLSENQTSVLTDINNKKYFVCGTKSNVTGWTYLYLQDYMGLVRSSELLKKTVFISTMIIFLFSLVLIYIFSLYLYKPLLKLMLNIKRYFSNKNFKEDNEYTLIDSIFKNIYEDNKKLTTNYNFVFQYFEKHSIQCLLNMDHFDKQSFEKALDIMGMELNFKKYIIIAIDLENNNFTADEENLMETYLNQHSDKISMVFYYEKKNRAILIVNTDYDEKEIYSVFKDLKELFNKSHIMTTISIGKIVDSLEQLHISYKEAIRQLESKFFSGIDEVIFNRCSFNHDVITQYDYSYEENIINSIKSQNKEKVVFYLEKLKNELKNEYISKSIDSIEYIKYLYFQLCTSIINNLALIGIKISHVYATRYEIFYHIQKAKSLEELQNFIISFAQECICLVTSLKETQHSEIIKKTMEYINKNFTRDISLDDIASSVYLSSRYLSRVFKQEVGCTIYEYITKLRMDYASRLIATTKEAQIKDIASEVGYNNVQSFIRFFKKYYSVTPEQYRKKVHIDDL